MVATDCFRRLAGIDANAGRGLPDAPAPVIRPTPHLRRRAGDDGGVVVVADFFRAIPVTDQAGTEQAG